MLLCALHLVPASQLRHYAERVISRLFPAKIAPRAACPDPVQPWTASLRCAVSVRRFKRFLVTMNTSTMKVTKRDGRTEPIDLDKIHRVVDWAANGLDNVSVSQVELRSHIQFYDGIRTGDIHE